MKSKKEAGYVEYLHGRNCRDCEYFKPTILRCSIVEGSIEPCGSCEYFERY